VLFSVIKHLKKYGHGDATNVADGQITITRRTDNKEGTQ